LPLTKRQTEILDYLEDYLAEHGYAPSYEEIAGHFGFASLATVHEHLQNLQRKGYIRKSHNESRSVELVRAEPRVAAVELPLLGRVAAGLPIEAIVDRETVSVPEDMLGRGGENYVLRVSGDSMIDEQIRDGDYIIVTSRQTAWNGEMVVALVDDESATVKKFYREADGRIRLQPANPQMEPLLYSPERVRIQGIVTGVIRRY
jgi:repressor LexA